MVGLNDRYDQLLSHSEVGCRYRTASKRHFRLRRSNASLPPSMMCVMASLSDWVSIAPSLSSSILGELWVGLTGGTPDFSAMILSASPLTTMFGLWVAKISCRLFFDVRMSWTMSMM